MPNVMRPGPITMKFCNSLVTAWHEGPANTGLKGRDVFAVVADEDMAPVIHEMGHALTEVAGIEIRTDAWMAPGSVAFMKHRPVPTPHKRQWDIPTAACCTASERAADGQP